MRERFSPHGSVRDRLGVPAAFSYPRWLADAASERHDSDGGNAYLYLAWELSRALKGGTSAEDFEAFQTLAVVLLLALDEGSTRLPLSALSRHFALLGAGGELAERARALLEPGSAASSLVGGPSDETPLIRDGEHLYFQRVHRRECELADHVRDRLSKKAERSELKVVLDALDAVLAHRPVLGGQPVRLSTEQQHAVRTALTAPLTLVSGGPGAGKTAIVTAVLRVLARLGAPMTEVTLSAADRRACSRLSESVRHHLASIPEPPHSDRELIATLPAVGCLELRPALSRFVLVAEAEKIDIETMEWLCRSVSPDAKLVLLGDDEQLASIESGGAFKDLLHRSSSAIALKENRRRDPDEVVRELPVRERADAVRFEGVELLVSDGDGFLERWYEEHVRPPGELGGTVEALKPPFGEEDRATLGRLLNHFRRSRVLGWTRREASLWNERLDRSPWCRPVLGHPEGELGLSLGGSLFFPSHLRPRDVGLAYAETLRGSGGSSFDRAVVVLPAPDHPLLLRHFLASALSAGHQSVTLLGSHEAVLAAARTAPERSTGLAERLERH